MAMSQSDALDEIHKILSGNAWSPDTLDAITEVMRQVGYEIADYNPDDEDD